MINTTWIKTAGMLAWVALTTGAVTVAESLTAEQRTEGRKTLLSALAPTQPGAFEARRNPAGEYIYEATSARPSVEGTQCAIESNKLVEGLTVVRMGGVVWRMPDQISNAGVFWRLGAIEPGAYWMGIWYESGSDKSEASQSASAPVQVYLNGRMVQLATHTDPVQVKPGVYFVEAQTGQAETLRPGDELTVCRMHGGVVARVILRKTPPAAGPHRIATNFGGHQWNPYTALGVNVEPIFKGRDGKALPYPDQYDAIERQARNRAAVVDSNGLATVDFVFANPLPVAVTIRHECVVRSYFCEEAARDERPLELPAHGRVVRTLTYPWAEGEPAYIAFATLKGEKVSGFRVRGTGKKPITADTLVEVLGWPEHEVYAYFPGHRHALPWPDPFSDRVVRRATLQKASDEYRDRLVLDEMGQHVKAWQRAFTPLLEPPMPPPADLKFDPVDVPFPWGWPTLDSMKPRPHAAYAQRRFVMPGDAGTRSCRLYVDEVTDEATAYVNGRKVGNVRGGNTPLECDITQAVRPGTNELTIVVRDLTAIMNPAYLNTNEPVPSCSYLDAPGLFSGVGLGLGSVAIKTAPRVSVEEVFVVTSVRKKTLGARLAVGNRTATPIRARIKAVVLDAGKPVLTVGEREVELAPHTPLNLELEAPWKNPRLWGPYDPHLYVLAVEVTDLATGARLDWRRERFGFRESWIAGNQILFNGTPIRPKGAGIITRLNPDGECRLVRGLGGDWADEIGCPGYRNITLLYNSSSQHNAERAEFWNAAQSNAQLSMKRLWNSPSVQAWDLSNEWLCFATHVVNDILVPARHMKRLSDGVRAADPTRWTLFNGDVDLRGLLDNQSFHYMTPTHHSEGFGLNGHSPFFPDAEFWRPLDRHYRPGETFPVSPFHYDIILDRDRKVIMDTEFLWKVGSLMPPGPTEFVGEDDVLSPAVDSASGPIAWMWKTKLDGHRDLGAAPVNIYSYHAGVQRGAYLDQTFIIPENQRRGFAGRKQTRRYTVLNGLFRPAELRLTWALRRSDGKVVEKGAFRHRMPSGGHECGEFSFVLPKVTGCTIHTLSATLESEGRFVAREEWDIDVWPDEPVKAGALARKVVLFESGTSNSQRPTANVQDRMPDTAATLTAAGVDFERVTELTDRADPSGTLLVIGENALTADNAASTAALTNFVATGGRVLVLRQSVAPRYLPVRATLAPQIWASQVYVRMGDHPVLKGLGDLDLHFWQPDRAVAQGAYVKPSSGNFVTLADSGAGDGMEQAHLLELYRDRGLYLLCQIPVVSRYDQEPMARDLLARLVRYAAGAEAFCQPTNTLMVMAEKDSPVAKRLAEMGAKVEHSTSNVQQPTSNVQRPTSNGILVDAAAGRDLSAAERAALGAALRGGATMVVAGATPADTNWLSELAGAPVSVTVTPYRMWEGRGYRRGWSRWTAGLSHLDLYWKRFDGDERANMQAEDPGNVIEPLQDYTARIHGGRECVYPGALVEVAVGRGRLLLDQRRWWTANVPLASLASRNLSALLTGLNVAIAPVTPPPELLKGLAYRTIDLTPYANRGLIDEMAEDGKGGWSDQGPRCDLRTFPTGPQLFEGVPFRVGKEPKVCVVLASKPRPGFATLPKAVDIPVGYPVEGLYFLHSAAFSGEGMTLASYTIEYADGRTVDIPLICGENISDWASPRPFMREKGTRSVIAWTGKNEVFPLVGVFRMLWVNPRPDVPVKQVRFGGPLISVPMLVGMTAAVRREAGSAAADAVALRARMDEAERTHDEERILESSWNWGLSGLPAPTPWNRYGEILEKRGDRRGALAAYKKSLEIEWNQPPVMEAVRRLEAH